MFSEHVKDHSKRVTKIKISSQELTKYLRTSALIGLSFFSFVNWLFNFQL